MGVQLVVTGVALGSIYALLALSIVLIHKSTGIVNFAQGEMATFTTFICFTLWSSYQVPLPIVVLLAVPLGGLLGALVELVIVRPMAADPPINLLILTIGLWIVFNSATGWIWDPYRMPSLFSTSAVDVLGVQVSPSSLGIVFMAFGAMALLYFFFEHTRFGAAMRAATMNNRAAKLVGVEPSHVTIAAWSIGGALSSLCGVLIAPTIFVDHDMMVSLLLKAFAGSVLGGFNSLPGAVVGSLALGVAESLLGSLVSTKFKDTAAFAVIVLVLMFKPAGLLGHSTRKKM